MGCEAREAAIPDRGVSATLDEVAEVGGGLVIFRNLTDIRPLLYAAAL